MAYRFPALNLKAKLIFLMVGLLALTLGAEVIVSLGTQEAIVESTQEKVSDLTRAIQISVQELTSVRPTDPDRLHNYVASLRSKGLEISIASTQNLIINSSNPKIVGDALQKTSLENANIVESRNSGDVPPVKLRGSDQTVYLIPVQVEDHLLGYVRVVANFGDFAKPLAQSRLHELTLAVVIFAIGLIIAYFLAERYVEPIHAVASAAQNIMARGLEPVPEGKRRDEIGLLTHSFNEMVGQLRHARERETELNRLERFTALGQLAGGLAHEIKNPLNFISLALDQLRARYAPQQPHDREAFLRQLAIMKEEMRRLADLVQSFLHYGKPIEIFPAPTDVRQLVDEVVALSESKMKSQSIDLVEEFDDAAPILNVDAEKLRACFINVIANAIQAMPEGGTMRIALRRLEGGAMVIRFSDTGAGIEAEVVNHVFEPFFTTKRDGIGLGLFLSKAIVEAHGGTIDIGPNADGPGTTLTFTFPPSAVVDGRHHDASLSTGR